MCEDVQWPELYTYTPLNQCNVSKIFLGRVTACIHHLGHIDISYPAFSYQSGHDQTRIRFSYVLLAIMNTHVRSVIGPTTVV